MPVTFSSSISEKNLLLFKNPTEKHLIHPFLSSLMEKPAVIQGEKCPACGEKKLSLIESEMDIPYFGKCYIFSMDCSACNYHKADVEAAEQGEPTRYTLDIDTEKDMRIRVVRSSQATVKIPYITTIEPNEGSNGYVTNVEGIFSRVKKQVELLRDSEEDEELKKKARNMLKKIMNIMIGREKSKLIIEDPSGNSAILSPKAVKTAMK